MANHKPEHPLTSLPEDDLNLITELVLSSGSLKDLARVYGVSYPTIRGRLDGVIRRVREAVEGRTPDPVARALADLVDRGELTPRGARVILETVRANGPAAPGSERKEKNDGA